MIRTEVEIEAPRDLVWKVLTMKEKWYRWNTYLYDCDPTVSFAAGRDVCLAVCRLPREAETEFRARTIVWQPGACLQWVSSIPGLHNRVTFELQAIDPYRTRYRHASQFSGILARIVVPFLRRDEQRGIGRMAWELKEFIETSRQKARQR